MNWIVACALDAAGVLLISLLRGQIDVLSLHLKNIVNFQKRSGNQSHRLNNCNTPTPTIYSTSRFSDWRVVQIVYSQITTSTKEETMISIYINLKKFLSTQPLTMTQLLFRASYTFSVLIQILTTSYASTSVVEMYNSLPVAAFP